MEVLLQINLEVLLSDAEVVCRWAWFLPRWLHPHSILRCRSELEDENDVNHVLRLLHWLLERQIRLTQGRMVFVYSSRDSVELMPRWTHNVLVARHWALKWSEMPVETVSRRVFKGKNNAAQDPNSTLQTATITIIICAARNCCSLFGLELITSAACQVRHSRKPGTRVSELPPLDSQRVWSQQNSLPCSPHDQQENWNKLTVARLHFGFQREVSQCVNVCVSRWRTVEREAWNSTTTLPVLYTSG